MKKRIKKLWVEALRSGEFGQGGGGLRPSKDSYCCLGVLCDLHRRTVGGRWRRDDREWQYGVTDDGEPATGVLPVSVLAWAGLDDADPQLGRKSASELNDGGRSFNYIADRIEKYL